jgi:hypothetical protein
MRVTSTLRFVPEINLPWLTLFLPPAIEHCAVGAPALADVSAFDPRLVVALPRLALAQVPASLALLP